MTDLTITDRVLDGPHGALRVRVYAPAAPTGPGLVWAHGGGFARGDIDMPEGDWVARAFAAKGIVVVSVDYRLAPLPAEWAARAGEPERIDGVHHPVAREEIAWAYAWASASELADGPWALGGASAGANLATGATLASLHAGDDIAPLLVLAYPTLHPVQPEPDARLRAALDTTPGADRFGPDVVRGMYENYLGGPVSTADIYAAPGLASASELAGFPPTIMINDDVDELRVSGEAFAQTLRAAHVDIDCSTEPGTQHGHLNRPEEGAAQPSIDRFAARILSLTAPTTPHPAPQPHSADPTTP
ncbi:alpha/beta hydrolase [Microbacterium sp. SSW1-59]|uniref:alpha/beta hydrolase n=1 Tax=Microbacterium xanthum TaxID=3079794 RepID=UPI002AD347F6|nr:alpha/beta hydrolase [Microbacterium sp. SSW1-59]MDZ8201030.1 alpha/beta hydrolase [Microbacterium sp. SSW1-59]